MPVMPGYAALNTLLPCASLCIHLLLGHELPKKATWLRKWDVS